MRSLYERSRTRDRVLFHFLCFIYDLIMIILRRPLVIATTLLIGIAVLVNFARPAPMVFVGEEFETAYVDEEAETPATENAGPKCPCPTEIENADCDEGLCSVTLNAADRSFVSSTPFSHEALILDVWHSAAFAPEPDPPRAVI